MILNEIATRQETLFVRPDNRPFLIAGPCSAESEEQVMGIARELAALGIDLFRAGIWKPRTRPGAFEGAGATALPWMQRVKAETGLRTTVEVANAAQVEQALAHGIDVLWIGARSSANPFSVQDIADALAGVDIPVMVKNPTNPDLELWIGAIERIRAAGIGQIAAIHRGFSTYAKSIFRNEPYWAIPIELRRRMPDIPLFCDVSHICGNRTDLADVAQYALDLNYDGLMTETHGDPDRALSDARQQITPAAYGSMLRGLVLKQETSDDADFLAHLGQVRHHMDELDLQILNLLARRMRLSEEIGLHKKHSRVSVLQVERWNEILEKAKTLGREMGLSEDFVSAFLTTVHQESIAKQALVKEKGKEQA
jgi:chorismate mutase